VNRVIGFIRLVQPVKLLAVIMLMCIEPSVDILADPLAHLLGAYGQHRDEQKREDPENQLKMGKSEPESPENIGGDSKRDKNRSYEKNGYGRIDQFS
jgi:hypothetical protein